jgi:hypothetical protein
MAQGFPIMSREESAYLPQEWRPVVGTFTMRGAESVMRLARPRLRLLGSLEWFP